MDPATLLLLGQSTKAIFGFLNTRSANKQYLQELHTSRLTTTLNAKRDINDRLDSSLEVQANNEGLSSSFVNQLKKVYYLRLLEFEALLHFYLTPLFLLTLLLLLLLTII